MNKPTIITRRNALGAFALTVLLGAILAANWVTTDYGFIPVGFGFMATAGTIFAGFALAARDLIHDAWGRRAVVGAILAGTVLSFAISAPQIAVASAAAFLLAELFDFAIYAPLRRRSAVGDGRWARAVLASNLGGMVMDTVVFLGVAFGFAAVGPALPGQLVGKTYATLLYLLLGVVIARVWRARTGQPVAAWE